MRGTKAKQLRQYAMRLFVEASSDERNKHYCSAQYLQNPKSGQIICGGRRGIYQAIKKMYRNNVEVSA